MFSMPPPGGMGPAVQDSDVRQQQLMQLLQQQNLLMQQQNLLMRQLMGPGLGQQLMLGEAGMPTLACSSAAGGDPCSAGGSGGGASSGGTSGGKPQRTGSRQDTSRPAKGLPDLSCFKEGGLVEVSERVEQAVRIVERPVRCALHAVRAVLLRVISQLLTPSFVLSHPVPLPLLLLQLYRWWVQEDKDGMSNKRRVRWWRLCCVGERDGKWGAAGGGAAPSNSSTLQLEGRTEDPKLSIHQQEAVGAKARAGEEPAWRAKSIPKQRFSGEQFSWVGWAEVMLNKQGFLSCSYPRNSPLLPHRLPSTPPSRRGQHVLQAGGCGGGGAGG